MRAIPILLVLAGLVVFACASRKQEPAPEKRATAIFTSDLWGQLEPCGCSANMRGGLDRAAAYVRSQEGALLVDAGDALFEATSYDEQLEVQARRKARAVGESLVAMGLDAKAVFERDRVLPQVLEAHVPKELLLDGPRVLDAPGGVKLGLVPVDALGGKDVSGALAEGVKKVRGQGADVVAALVHARRPEVLAISSQAAKAGADFVVGSHIDSIPEGEEARAVQTEIPVFFTQARGQSLLQVDLVVRPGGGKLQLAGNETERQGEIESIEERLKSYQQRIDVLPPGADAGPFHAKMEELRERRRKLADQKLTPPVEGSYLAYKFVPVTEDRSSDPAVSKILESYDHDVAQANLAYARASDKKCPEAAPGEAAFVGGEACKACHAAAHEVWQASKHAHAFETLEKVNKQYDLGCISCHVTGWEQPGGPCRVDKVEGRKDVTCENCHGPGSLHVKAPGKGNIARKVPESVCVGCHTPENSTAWDFESYLPRILGPGHQMGGKQ